MATYTLPQKGRFRQFCFLFGCQGAKSRLSEKDSQPLANYLGACQLYVDCLDVANVSDREGFRDRLLRAPVAREGE